MSIQSQLNRLTSAKSALRSAISAKGVTVPAATTLDGYSALVAQITTGDMNTAVYDPQGKARDIFAEIAANTPLYTATFRVNGWSEASASAKSKGYAYQQTVSLLPVKAGAPTVTANSEFVTGCSFLPVGVAETDQALAEALTIINNGYTTSGTGAVTTLVTEKPAVDITVRWALRTEVN